MRLCEEELIAAKDISCDPVRFGGAIWAGVHGIASLLLNMPPSESEDSLDPRRAITSMADDIEDTIRILFAHLLT